MNVMETLLIKSPSSFTTDFDVTTFEFNGTYYNIGDILKLTRFIPTKKYKLTTLLPILKKIELPTLSNDVITVSKYLKHVLNFNIQYLLVLQIDDLNYKYIYGSEYVVKSLITNVQTLSIKVMTTTLLQQLYLKNKINIKK